MAGENTLNYEQQGGSVLVIGGELQIAAGGKITNAGTQAGAITTLTDSTGGVTNDTLAAITAPAGNATTALTADMTAVKNALATLALKVNSIVNALHGSGLTG